MTVQCDWVEYVATATPPVYLQADGQVVHSLGAGVVQSIDYQQAAMTAPAALAREYTPCEDQWTLTLAWTMGQAGCGLSWLGLSKPEAVNTETTLELTTGDYEDAYADDYAGGAARNLIIGGSAYDGSAGEGAVIFIPAALLAMDPVKPDVGQDYLRTMLDYRAGRYGGDDGVTRAANSSFRLGLG